MMTGSGGWCTTEPSLRAAVSTTVNSSHCRVCIQHCNAAAVPTAKQGEDPRLGMMSAYPQFMTDMASKLLPVLMDVYSSVASVEVREKCLVAILKIVNYATSEDLTVWGSGTGAGRGSVGCCVGAIGCACWLAP